MLGAGFSLASWLRFLDALSTDIPHPRTITCYYMSANTPQYRLFSLTFASKFAGWLGHFFSSGCLASGRSVMVKDNTLRTLCLATLSGLVRTTCTCYDLSATARAHTSVPFSSQNHEWPPRPFNQRCRRWLRAGEGVWGWCSLLSTASASEYRIRSSL